ncbi:thiol-disulfide oxidoreductase DCC family protein [Propionibacterium sp.]|uniref:thiol-disulfide oxidoreductase DCC family protein n=1 Tax=Propionibacterium sp. TaxID=1977903 RepID=UPI0039EB810C
MNSSAVDLVFDGQCGFCTRCVMWIARRDRHSRVRLHPAQRAGVQDRFGLTEADIRSTVWAFRSGRRSSGAAAISLVLDAALGVRVCSAVHRLPGVHQVQEKVYQWVANHRYLLPGAAPWCNQHPGDCEPVAGGSSSCSSATSGTSRPGRAGSGPMCGPGAR